MKELKIILINDNAKLPTRGSEGAAGYDLYSISDINIKPWESLTVNTGIKMVIPKGYYGSIESRSGLAVKNGIEKGAGTIDSDYRGEIIIALRNFSDNMVRINSGDRVAQIIFKKYETFNVVQVDEIEYTERGDGGFGSTGK